MAKRKKWEPEYRFGGNPADCIKPNPLGENKVYYHQRLKSKRRKR
jgi:hypothetical protein